MLSLVVALATCAVVTSKDVAQYGTLRKSALGKMRTTNIKPPTTLDRRLVASQDEATTDCFPGRVDFSTAGDLSPLHHGDYVKTQWLDAYGLTVEASATRGGFTPDGQARIFNTSVVPSEDLDLNSPNVNCGGAGVGVGGEPGQVGANCNPLGEGNVLIIQESDKVEPDDNAYGGSFSFTFQDTVTFNEIGLLDLQGRANYMTIELDNGFSREKLVTGLGDNSIQTEVVGQDGVKQVSLKARNSVGIRFVDFCMDTRPPSEETPTQPPPTPIPTPKPTPKPTKAPTKAPTVAEPLRVQLSASPSVVLEPGAISTFTLTITNNNDESAVAIDSLVFSGIPDNSYCTVPATIPAGQDFSCTFTSLVSGNAVDDSQSVNVSVAGQVDESALSITGQGETAVVIENAEPQIRVKKTVIRTDELEGVVLVEVQNDSVDSDPVTLFALVHSLYGDVSQYQNCTLPITIESGEFFSCTFTVDLPPDVVDVNLGKITAYGFDDEGTAVTAVDDELLTYCAAAPTELLTLGPLLNTSVNDIGMFLIDGKVIPELQFFVEQVRSVIPLQAIGNITDVDIIRSVMLQDLSDEEEEESRQLEVYEGESTSRELITVDEDCIVAVSTVIVDAIGLFFAVAGFWGVSAGASTAIGKGVAGFLKSNSRFIRKLIVIAKKSLPKARKYAEVITTIFTDISIKTLGDIIKDSLSWSDYLILFGSILLQIAAVTATGGASIAINVAAAGVALFSFINSLLAVPPACADPLTQAPVMMITGPPSVAPSSSPTSTTLPSFSPTVTSSPTSAVPTDRPTKDPTYSPVSRPV